MKTYANVEDYIAAFPVEKQTVLQKIRETIQKAAPEASEKISYGIPTYVHKGNLVHFGGYDKYFALYPGSKGVEAFKEALKGLDTSKGTVRFAADQPVPYDLIRDITTELYNQRSSKK